MTKENADRSPSGAAAPLRGAEPDPVLLQRAVDDREAHLWRYYRLDYDTMKRIADQLAYRAERAEAALALAQRERDELPPAGIGHALGFGADATWTDCYLEIARLQQRTAEAQRTVAQLRDAATQAAIVLEGLAAAVEWELAPSIMAHIRQDVVPALRAALAAGDAPEE